MPNDPLAELWLEKPCDEHGLMGSHSTGNYNDPGSVCRGSRVRLNPEEYTVGELGWNEVPHPGRYLVIPLDALEEIDALEEE